MLTGRVTDSVTKQALPYASVFLSDPLGNPTSQAIGTTTSFEGYYSLPSVGNGIMPGEIVTVSYLGYTKQTQYVSGSLLNFSLDPSGQNLSEFEIIAKRIYQSPVFALVIIGLAGLALVFSKHSTKSK